VGFARIPPQSGILANPLLADEKVTQKKQALEEAEGFSELTKRTHDA
jgi:hypothetical protein